MHLSVEFMGWVASDMSDTSKSHKLSYVLIFPNRFTIDILGTGSTLITLCFFSFYNVHLLGVPKGLVGFGRVASIVSLFGGLDWVGSDS